MHNGFRYDILDFWFGRISIIDYVHYDCNFMLYAYGNIQG